MIFATTTIDGRLASRTRFSKLSCPEDKRRQFWLRCNVDAVLVGANTVIIDDPSLRPKEFQLSRPRYHRIVLDGRLRIPLNARILDVSQYPTIVVTTTKADESKIRELKKRGVEVLVYPDRINLDRMLCDLLELYGIRRLMIEGGGETIWSFIEERVVDELRITIAPKIFGGRDSVSLAMGTGFEGPEAPSFRPVFIGVCRCLNEVHIIYRATQVKSAPVENGIGVLNNFTFSLVLDQRVSVIGGISSYAQRG